MEQLKQIKEQSIKERGERVRDREKGGKREQERQSKGERERETERKEERESKRDRGGGEIAWHT